MGALSGDGAGLVHGHGASAAGLPSAHGPLDLVLGARGLPPQRRVLRLQGVQLEVRQDRGALIMEGNCSQTSWKKPFGYFKTQWCLDFQVGLAQSQKDAIWKRGYYFFFNDYIRKEDIFNGHRFFLICSHMSDVRSQANHIKIASKLSEL